MNKGSDPFIQRELTENAINDQIEKALEEGVQPDDIETMEAKLEDYDRRLKEKDLSEDDRKKIQERRDRVAANIDAYYKTVKKVKENIETKKGGCYLASATFVDAFGQKRQLKSLLVGEEVQIITNNEVSSQPVITFIHRQPDAMQQFLKITTLKKKKVLKITEDHLLFVKKDGQPSTIPARDVRIGDTVYVRGGQDAVETDTVQSISSVFEKGVYAPVTLGGTILVNDVHTSCYFDVLSHEWSHRAMGIARAVYHVSPWMVQWISNIGQEDGFPGWYRLAHKILTFWD